MQLAMFSSKTDAAVIDDLTKSYGMSAAEAQELLHKVGRGGLV